MKVGGKNFLDSLSHLTQMEKTCWNTFSNCCAMYSLLKPYQSSLACLTVGANTGSLNGCHPAPLCTFTHSACASSMYSTAKLPHIELREVSGVQQRLPRCNKTCPNHLDRIYLLTNTSQVIGCSITRSTVRNYA